jgi:diadenosine tetraphosphate (Ap4A) HIT family hydrolase
VGLNCILCTAQLDTPVIRESQYWRTVINRNQNLLGKLFIALRRHEEDVTWVTTDEWDELRGEIRWATERLTHAFAPDHFNYSFLMNVDRHVHLHVIPRYVGVRSFAGLEFSDPDYPDAYRLVPSRADVAGTDLIAGVAAALRPA